MCIISRADGKREATEYCPSYITHILGESMGTYSGLLPFLAMRLEIPGDRPVSILSQSLRDKLTRKLTLNSLRVT